MKTWITSDLHFGHKNIMKFCPQTRARFRDDVGYMNSAMVEEWNAKVEPEDLVYILGDVAFMSGSDAGKTMHRLNGRKILVEGNHDRKTRNRSRSIALPLTPEGRPVQSGFVNASQVAWPMSACILPCIARDVRRFMNRC